MNTYHWLLIVVLSWAAILWGGLWLLEKLGGKWRW